MLSTALRFPFIHAILVVCCVSFVHGTDPLPELSSELTSIIEMVDHIMDYTKDIVDENLLIRCETSRKQIDFISRDKSQHHLIETKAQTILLDLCPAYTKKTIGTLSDSLDYQTTLLAYAQSLNNPAEQSSMVVSLVLLAQKYRTDTSLSLDTLEKFYNATNLENETIINKLNNPHTVTTTLSALSKQFLSSSDQGLTSLDKYKGLESLVGGHADSSKEHSILGRINTISMLKLDDSPFNGFKDKWIGEDEYGQKVQDITRSLFATVYETQTLIASILSENTEEKALDALILQIGLDGDTESDTFFGALHQLEAHIHDPFDTFDRYFGLTQFYEGSAFFASNRLRADVLEAAHVILPEELKPCHIFLYPTTIEKIRELELSDSSEALSPSVISAIKKLLLEDMVEHITRDSESSILFQYQQIYNSTATLPDCSYLADRIGVQESNGKTTPFSIYMQTHRLVTDLEGAASTDAAYPFLTIENMDYYNIYQALLGNLNSIQSNIYAIQAKQDRNDYSFTDIIGYILSRDKSLFGIINQLIGTFEIDAMLQRIGEPLADVPTSGTIIDQLKTIYEKSEGYPMLSAKDAIGSGYQAESLSNSTIINALCDFSLTIPYIFPMIPRSSVWNYVSYICGKGVPGILDKNMGQLCTQILERLVTLPPPPAEDEEDTWGDLKNKTACEEITQLIGQTANQDGETIWVMLNNIFNDLYMNMLNIFIPQEENLQPKHIETVLHNLKMEEETPFYTEKIYIIKDYVQRTQAMHSRFSFTALVFNIHGSFQEFTNLPVCFATTTQGNSFEPQGLFETIQTTDASVGISSFGNPSDAVSVNSIYGQLNNCLYTIIVGPFLEMLGDSETNDNTQAYGLLKSIVESLKIKKQVMLLDEQVEATALDDVDAVLQKIGQPTDAVTEENLDNVSLFGLLNMDRSILAKSYLFMSADTYKHVLDIIGSYYDTTKAALDRSFFSGLQYIYDKIQTNMENSIRIINQSIGTPSAAPDGEYKSLFYHLNNLLYRMAPDYYTYMYYPQNPDKRSTIDSPLYNNLIALYEKVNTPSYESLPEFVLFLEQFGNPNTSPKTGFLASLEHTLSRFDAQHKRVRSLRSFFMYTKLFQDSTVYFVKNVHSIEPENYLPLWEDYLTYMFSNGECLGCHAANAMLEYVSKSINTLIKNLQTVPYKIALLQSSYILEVLDALRELNHTTEQMLADYMATSNNCFFAQDLANNPTICNTVIERVSAINTALTNLWTDTQVPYAEVDYSPLRNNDCLTMQNYLNELGQQLTLLSRHIIVPDMYTTIPLQNEVALHTIRNLFVDLITAQPFDALIQSSQCVGCVMEELEPMNVTKGFSNLVDSLDRILTFLNDGHYHFLAKSLHTAARTVEQTSEYLLAATVSIDTAILQYAIERGDLGDSMRGIASLIEPLPEYVGKIHTYIKNGPSSVELMRFLQQVQTQLNGLRQQMCVFTLRLYPKLQITPEWEEDYPLYKESDICVMLGRLVEALTSMKNSWHKFFLAVQHLTKMRKDPLLIPAFSKLSESYGKIINQLKLFDPRDFLWGQNGANTEILPYLGSLYSGNGVLPTTQKIFDGIVEVLSDLCITSCVQPLQYLVTELGALSSLIQSAPSVLTLEQLIVFCEARQTFLKDIYKMLSESKITTECLHTLFDQRAFVATQAANAFRMAIESWNTLPPVTNAEPQNTFEDLILQMVLHITTIHTGLDNLYQKIPKPSTCQSSLFNALENVRDLERKLQKFFTQSHPSAGTSVCLYNPNLHQLADLWPTLENSLEKNASNTADLITKLRADVLCEQKLIEPGGILRIRSIFLLAYLQEWIATKLTSFFEEEFIEQTTAFLAPFHKALLAWQKQLEVLTNFFANAPEPSACIAPCEAILSEFNNIILTIEQTLGPLWGKRLLPDITHMEWKLSTITQKFHECSASILAIQKNLQIPAHNNLGVFNQKLKIIARTVENIFTQTNALVAAMCKKAHLFKCATAFLNENIEMMMDLPEALWAFSNSLTLLTKKVDEIARAYILSQSDIDISNTAETSGDMAQVQWFFAAVDEDKIQRDTMRIVYERVHGDKDSATIEESREESAETYYDLSIAQKEMS